MNRTVDAVRSTSEQVGAHLPEAFGSIRDDAIEGVTTVRSWPDPTRQLAAGIAFGLALGFTLAGAPRLLAAFALVPAIVVSAPGFDRR